MNTFVQIMCVCVHMYFCTHIFKNSLEVEFLDQSFYSSCSSSPKFLPKEALPLLTNSAFCLTFISVLMIINLLKICISDR